MSTLLRGLVVCLALVPAFASAQTLVVTKAGYFLLEQDAAGNPSLKKIATVINLDSPGDPQPPPPVDQFRGAVKKATDEVVDPNKANTKTALAKLYRTTSQLPVTTAAQVREATAVIFGALQLPQVWTAWKAKVDAAVVASFGEDVDKTKSGWQVIAETLEAP